MEKSKRVIRFLDNYIELIFGSVFLSLMVIFTFANIVMRLLLRTTLPWFQELTRYLFVWMVFIGSSAAVKYGKHIRITFLQTFLKGKIAHVVEVIVYIICAVFGAIIVYYAVPMMASFQTMTASSMPWFKMSWLYGIMPVGMSLFVIRNIQAIFAEVKAFRSAINNSADISEKKGGGK